MSDKKNTGEVYLSDESVYRFFKAGGGIVTAVICHLWQNNLQPGSPVELIDNLELKFNNRDKLVISSNNDGTGLEAIEFEFEKAADELKNEFGDKIRLFAVNASSTKMWTEIVGKELLGIRLQKDGENYLAGSVLLDFGSEKREVAISPTDGIIIDYFEQ